MKMGAHGQSLGDENEGKCEMTRTVRTTPGRP
jgi:hypothetical protein